MKTLSRAYTWLYGMDKSMHQRVIKLALSLTVGGLGGWAIVMFALTLNPLYIPPILLMAFNLGMLFHSIWLSGKKIKEFERKFKEEHDGVNMWDYLKLENDKNE